MCEGYRNLQAIVYAGPVAVLLDMLSEALADCLLGLFLFLLIALS